LSFRILCFTFSKALKTSGLCSMVAFDKTAIRALGSS
jgi:hypothetical protein